METVSYLVLVQYMPENGCCKTILDVRWPATSTRYGKRSCDRPVIGKVKGGKGGTYDAYWNGKLQYLSWLLWRCVMLCDAVLCMLCSVKHVKTVSTVRPCAAVVLVLKKHVLHFKIVYYCVVHWMSTTWNVGRYGVMLLVVCDVVCRIVYVWSCVMVCVYDWCCMACCWILSIYHTISTNIFIIICWRCCCCYRCLLVGLLLAGTLAPTLLLFHAWKGGKDGGVWIIQHTHKCT